jgi:hypothetical protein
MFKHLWKVALGVFLAMLVHTLYFWGGIGLTPNVGDRVLMQSAKRMELGMIGVAFYTHTGTSVMGMLAPEAAKNYAANEVGSVYPSLDGDQYMAVEKIRSAMDSLQKLSHSGTPIALLATILLYWRRPKPLRSLGR